MAELECPITDLFALCISGEHLDKLRPFIEKGLEALDKKIPSEYGYDDLYNMCAFGAANLFVVFDSLTSKEYGFFVLDTDITENEISVGIMYAYCDPDAPKYALTYGLQKSIDFAIIVKAKRLVFDSPRKGWAKVAKRMGFKSLKNDCRVKRFVMDL